MTSNAFKLHFGSRSEYPPCGLVNPGGRAGQAAASWEGTLLTHPDGTKWEFKYHVVFIPNYRKKRIYGGIRRAGMEQTQNPQNDRTAAFLCIVWILCVGSRD